MQQSIDIFCQQRIEKIRITSNSPAIKRIADDNERNIREAKKVIPGELEVKMDELEMQQNKLEYLRNQHYYKLGFADGMKVIFAVLNI